MSPDEWASLRYHYREGKEAFAAALMAGKRCSFHPRRYLHPDSPRRGEYPNIQVY
jgi:hypothetical protein